MRIDNNFSDRISFRSTKGPTQLQGPFDSTEFPAGCNGACDVGLSSDPEQPPNCCTGNYDSDDTSTSCPSSGPGTSKSICPNA
ncbi:hypothetical protein EDB84DRAFT_1478005, partial [Lactarius hengduanensis]